MKKVFKRRFILVFGFLAGLGLFLPSVIHLCQSKAASMAAHPCCQEKGPCAPQFTRESCCEGQSPAPSSRPGLVTENFQLVSKILSPVEIHSSSFEAPRFLPGRNLVERWNFSPPPRFLLLNSLLC